MSNTPLALEKYRARIPVLTPRDLLVVAVTPHFLQTGYIADFFLPDEWGMDVNVFFTADQSLVPEADALWFHGPNITSLPARIPGQKWILMSMESDAHYPFLRDDRLRSLFDFTMTYRLDSDIPCLYANWQDYQGFSSLPDQTGNRADLAPAVYIASNPVAERDDFVAELMETFAVDCLGKCLNNRSIESLVQDLDDPVRSRFSDVRHILGQYRFQISIENSRATDYVTEKLFLPFSAGCVPVYHGAPNVADFLPASRSIINVRDFDSPASLGRYLHTLIAKDEAYARYLDWRIEPPSNSFADLVNLGSVSPKYRMALKLLHGCGPECRCGGRAR